MATEQIIIEYIAQVEGMKAQLRSVQAELKNVQKTGEDSAKGASEGFKKAGESIKDVAKEIALSLGIAFSVGKAIEFAKESIKAFQEAEEVANKLKFAVTKIGGEGAAAFQKLSDQADKLSKKSIFSDESIRGAQTMLSQLGLNSTQIEKLIPKVIDLASATGEDLATATNRAIGGINGMAKANKDIGADFKDTGDKTQNLNVLMDKLGKFTGAAGDAMETAAGQAKFLENQTNELQESIGEKLSPVWGAFKLALFEITEGYIDMASASGRTFQVLKGEIGLSREQAKELTDLGFALRGTSEETKKAAEQLLLFKKSTDFFASSSKNAKEDVQILIGELKKQEVTTNTGAIKFNILKKAIDDMNESISKGSKSTLPKTQAGIAAELAAKKKFLDDNAKNIEEAQKEADRQSDVDIKQLERETDLKKKLAKEVGQAEVDSAKDATAEASKLYDEDLANKKKAEDKKLQAEREVANEVRGLINDIGDFRKAQDDYSLSLLQENLNNGLISQTDYDKNVRKIKTKAAEREKELGILNVVIETAKAIAKAVAEFPITGGLPFSAIAAGIGAAQIALILARPIPLAKGAIDLQGGTRGKDSISAMLMPGESVMTTEETSRHKDLLQSIRNDNLDKYILENYVNPKISNIINSTAENLNNSSKINFPDEYALARVMKRNKGVQVDNADYLASKIASEIASKVNQPKRTWS